MVSRIKTFFLLNVFFTQLKSLFLKEKNLLYKKPHVIHRYGWTDCEE